MLHEDALGKLAMEKLSAASIIAKPQAYPSNLVF